MWPTLNIETPPVRGGSGEFLMRCHVVIRPYCSLKPVGISVRKKTPFCASLTSLLTISWIDCIWLLAYYLLRLCSPGQLALLSIFFLKPPCQSKDGFFTLIDRWCLSGKTFPMHKCLMLQIGRQQSRIRNPSFRMLGREVVDGTWLDRGALSINWRGSN